MAEREGEVPRGWLFGWGKHASEEAIREAARDLLIQTDERMLVAYLRIFDLRAFPLDPQRLVELAESGNADVATAALRALRHVTHPSVRALALHLIERGKPDGDVVRLLKKQFARGDEQRIEPLLGPYTDEDKFHWLAHAAVEVFEANLDAEAQSSMLRVYEQCRCSICRAGAVEVLIGRGDAPPWLLEECRYDSNLDIREKVQNVGKQPSGKTL